MKPAPLLSFSTILTKVSSFYLTPCILVGKTLHYWRSEDIFLASETVVLYSVIISMLPGAFPAVSRSFQLSPQIVNVFWVTHRQLTATAHLMIYEDVLFREYLLSGYIASSFHWRWSVQLAETSYLSILIMMRAIVY